MSVSEGRSPRSLANFCAQAADLVRVRSLSCTRNTRSRHFRQKNTYVLAQFPSDPLPGLLWPRCLPDASQMSPRCLPDASQMPLRCLSDASQMPPDASQSSQSPESSREPKRAPDSTTELPSSARTRERAPPRMSRRWLLREAPEKPPP